MSWKPRSCVNRLRILHKMILMIWQNTGDEQTFQPTSRPRNSRKLQVVSLITTGYCNRNLWINSIDEIAKSWTHWRYSQMSIPPTHLFVKPPGIVACVCMRLQIQRPTTHHVVWSKQLKLEVENGIWIVPELVNLLLNHQKFYPQYEKSSNKLETLMFHFSRRGHAPWTPHQIECCLPD